MADSNIEWTDKVWNAVRGCTRVSRGCENCYAERVAMRFSGNGQPYEGLVKITNGHPQWTGKIHLAEDKLNEPLRWKKPRRVFVNSMSDLFHEDVPFEYIDRVFAVMALSPRHTFQILTKRPKRMLGYAAALQGAADSWAPKTKNGQFSPADVLNIRHLARHTIDGQTYATAFPYHPWPLPNVWLGVSVEDQKTADERIPLLLQTPAAVRWISYEPGLGAVNLARIRHDHPLAIEGNDTLDALSGNTHYKGELTGWLGKNERIGWVVIGGESGPGARPFNIQWARDVIAQCKAAVVPVFVKQLGSNPLWTVDDGLEHCFQALGKRVLRDRKGGDMEEWPSDLRIREYPA